MGASGQNSTATADTGEVSSTAVTAQEMTAVAATTAVTETSSELVPPNLKIKDTLRVIAYTKDADFAGYKMYDSMSFDDPVEAVIEFVSNNSTQTVQSGTTVTVSSFSELEGFDNLSDELQYMIEKDFRRLCGISSNGKITNFVNGNDTFECTFVLLQSEEKDEYYLGMYKK